MGMSVKERVRAYRARKAAKEKIERLRGTGENNNGSFQSAQIAASNMTVAYDETGDDLQRPGCILETLRDKRAETLQEELESALLWAGLLGIGNPVIVGQTTLDDLCGRIFYEWLRRKCPLLNPVTMAFSKRWHGVPAAKTFEEAWRRIEGSNQPITQEMLSAAQSEPKPESQNPDTPVVSPAEPKTAAEQLREWQAANGQAPTLRYSAKIMPPASES